MALPRYLAAAAIDDLERTLSLADELSVQPRANSAVCLLQAGGPSAVANELSRLLNGAGRSTVSLVVKDRRECQSDATLAKLSGVGAVWVFADDLFESFMKLFATQLAFALRSKAKQGMPVVGIGGGALALGGLVLANRICRDSRFDLVGGLGWAPRVLVDAGAERNGADGSIARNTVRSLPGLLAMDLGARGGVKVDGGRVQSIGTEPISLLGAGDNGSLLAMSLDPGQSTTIAPPPFAPFERGLLPPDALRALTPASQQAKQKSSTRPPSLLRQPPQTPDLVGPPESDGSHAEPGSGRVCPMCKKVHAAEARLELAA